jgi:hypothetical protein
LQFLEDVRVQAVELVVVMTQIWYAAFIFLVSLLPVTQDGNVVRATCHHTDYTGHHSHVRTAFLSLTKIVFLESLSEPGVSWLCI